MKFIKIKRYKMIKFFQLLQKKIPSNKRYNGIEARVDTGNLFEYFNCVITLILYKYYFLDYDE